VSDLVELNDEDFTQIVELVHTRFGIDLNKKRTLIRGRLNSTIRKLGYTSFSQYMDAVHADTTGRKLLDMVDRLSTNHTFFFREADHIHFLTETAFPSLWGDDIAGGLRDCRIWCAASSSGEEPYSILIRMADEYGLSALPNHPIILGTDISTSALETARRGRYPLSRVKTAGDIVKRGYATQISDEEIEIKPTLRSRVLYKRLNLVNDDFPFKNKFDVIFCRNVMIYFDMETRRKLVTAMHRFLRPHGYLFLGHSESMGRNVSGYDYIRPAVYRRST
jgi:chemotaxis protein methyltransferase CheR